MNIQTALVDTRELLEEVVQTCDFLLEDDGYLASVSIDSQFPGLYLIPMQLRECSERDEWILRLRSEKAEVVKKCQKGHDDRISFIIFVSNIFGQLERIWYLGVKPLKRDVRT